MRTALLNALAEQDPKTLLLWWGAPPGADVADPAVWKAASPYWTPERAEYVAAKYAKALAGEQDPEFDDPDPMRGFACQYANSWALKDRRQVGEPLVDADLWVQLSAPVPAGTPAAVAVESWPGAGVTVAAAWRTEIGRVLVSATAYPDVASAAAAAKAWGCRTPVQVGASLVSDAAFKTMRTESCSGSVVAAVADLARWLDEGTLLHDGSAHLAAQITATRIKATPTGLRVVSAGPSDAVKAAAWAFGAARARKPNGRPRIILPSAS